jgi:hypothetical protein
LTKPTSPAYQFEQKNYYDRPWTTAAHPPEPDYSTPFAEKVLAITDELAELLVTKNQAYGNSALDPIRIFSTSTDPEDGLDVRIDDKLSRIARGHEFQGDDTLKDLIGYLIMKLIYRKQKEESE